MARVAEVSSTFILKSNIPDFFSRQLQIVFFQKLLRNKLEYFDIFNPHLNDAT